MTLLFPVISGNKLNIYCIYIKNYTVVERGWCLFYWGAPRGEVSPDQFPCLVTPARGCLENACTAKLIQKRIHNLGGLSNFVAPSFFFFYPLSFLLFYVLIALSSQTKFCTILLFLETGLFSVLWPLVHVGLFSILSTKKRKKEKMHLIHWVLGGFTNIAIKQSQCFYCALDLKIEAGLTAGSRRTYGKGLVFVCLYGDEWPVSTRWLVCTIKLSKRKDFFPNSAFWWRIMEFRVVCDCRGTCRASQGRGRRSAEFSALRPVWRSSQRGCGDKCRLISYMMGRLISTLHQMKDIHEVTLWFNKLRGVYPWGFTKWVEFMRKCATECPISII